MLSAPSPCRRLYAFIAARAHFLSDIFSIFYVLSLTFCSPFFAPSCTLLARHSFFFSRARFRFAHCSCWGRKRIASDATLLFTILTYLLRERRKASEKAPAVGWSCIFPSQNDCFFPFRFAFDANASDFETREVNGRRILRSVLLDLFVFSSQVNELERMGEWTPCR